MDILKEILTPDVIFKIIAVLTSLLAAIFAVKFKRFKEVLKTIVKAADDDKFSKDEIVEIIASFKNMIK